MICKKISIALFVFVLSFACAWAITPAQLEMLTGASTDNIPASEYAKVYPDAFSHLIEQTEKTTGDVRYGHQVMLQQICLHAARPGAEQQRLAMSKALAATLKSKTMTPEVRYWVLLQIERTGKAEVLDVLTESLGSSDKIEQGCARAALEKNADPRSTDILLKALTDTQDEAFAAGVISSLGNRQDSKGFKAISGQLDHKNATVAAAAVNAMVKINATEASAMLKQKLSPTHPAGEAIAKGLNEIATMSSSPQANAIYEQLYAWSGKAESASNAYSIRKAALIGMAGNGAAGVDKIIMANFQADDPSLQSMAIAAAAVTKDSQTPKAMAENSDQLDEGLQGQLIVMLAGRNEPSAVTPIEHAVKTGGTDLLRTAIETLSQMETRTSAAMLLEMTRHEDSKIARYARQKVMTAGNDHIDALLQTAAQKGDDKQRAEAIVLLGERKTPNMTEKLFKYAESGNKEIYAAAFEAIGLSASADKIPDICNLVKTSTEDGFKASALSAINQVLRNSSDQKAAYAVILKEIKAADGELKVDFLTTLKMSRDADAMDYCLGLLSDAEGKSFDSPIPQTALKMLSSWADPMAAERLLERAKTSQHKTAYAQAALDLAKNMLRYSKAQAKQIAKDVKTLNASETINQNADKIVEMR